MNELDELAVKYGADKWGKHHYTPVYYDLFKDIKDEVYSILEIGIAEGASLRMWRDFFLKAVIYGMDNDQIRVEKLEDEQRMDIFYGNQSDIKDLNDIPGNIEIIIDDGSHNPSDQVLTCLALMSRIPRYGVYIIEDVDDATTDSIKQILETKYNVDVRHVGNRHDDRLIIVRHKDG